MENIVNAGDHLDLVSEEDLVGRRVAVLMTDGVEQVEYTEPRSFLEQKGVRVTLVSPKGAGEDVQGMNHDQPGDKFKPISMRCCCRVGKNIPRSCAGFPKRLPSSRPSTKPTSRSRRSATGPGR